MNGNAIGQVSVTRVTAASCEVADDLLAIEEPLEIALVYGDVNPVTKQVAITMRTPGNDEELALGFLFTEGIISRASQVASAELIDTNKIVVMLHPEASPQLANAERNFYTTSSCGVCGKTSIDAIRTVSRYPQVQKNIQVGQEVFTLLERKLSARQNIFSQTGGLHSCALFDLNGDLIDLREDVGRHNALDKLIGAAFFQNVLPLSNKILLLSGRASFELIQKAAMAGINIVAAVGAPSSLAVELAKEMNITLIGFLRNERFNIYANPERITLLVTAKI
jgi:FdhD protein